MEATMLTGLVTGCALGGALTGVLGWILGGVRARSGLEPALRASEARAHGAAATVDELRSQVGQSRLRIEALDVELRRLEGEKAAGVARADEMQRGIAEQGRLLDEAKVELAMTFQALAAETLQKNNEGFLQLANEKLTAAQREGSTELAAREQAIAALVGPVKQSLEKFDQQVHALERVRGEAYVRLTEQVSVLADGQKRLQSGTDNLVTALRAPAVRGRWGEIQLRRVMEIAGMMEYSDFVEQETVTTPEGRLRPDVVVRLPGGRCVVVDAKAPLGAYLEAIDAKSEAERETHLRHHAAQVRAHVLKLGAKNYWDQFPASPAVVVMFLPGDRFYAAALEQMPGLLEEAFANRVLVATPTTLIGVLQAVHVGWKEERLAANAESISRCGRDLHERIATFAEHMVKMGGMLGRTVSAFNDAVGSLGSRVLPGARRLEELGAAGKKDLPDIDPIDRRPRPLVSSDSEPHRPASPAVQSLPDWVSAPRLVPVADPRRG